MHGRGWERFLSSGTEAEPASPAVPAGCPAVPSACGAGQWLRWFPHLRTAAPHASRFLVWDGRVDGTCATFRVRGELLHVSRAVLVVAVLWV